MKTVKIVLDGNEHEVCELRSRENSGWRELLQEQAADIVTLIQGAPSTNVSDGAALAGLVGRISEIVLGSVDTILELCREYAPRLPWDEAYDSEIVEAFWQILGLAYPFGLARLGGLVQQLNALGSPAPPTKPS